MDVLGTDNDAVANFRKGVEHSLDVFGVNVQTFRCDDDILLASTIIQPAFRVDFAEVARVKPVAVCCCDTLSPDEDLSIRSNLQFLTFDHLAQRSRTNIKRM